MSTNLGYVDRGFYLHEFWGNTIPLDSLDFDKFSFEASSFIDYITFNRVRKFDTVPNEVKLATCSIMELMYQFSNSKIKGQGLIKTGERIGDYQVTYAIPEGEKNQYYSAAKTYLENTGLLYRGL